MSKELLKKRLRRGQGLVEYAIIIALVALVVIVIITLVGFATKRGFGVIAGALGATHNETTGTGTHIEITDAHCWTYVGLNQTGVYVRGLSNLDPSLLTGSTDTGWFSVANVGDSGPRSFKYQPLIGTGTDFGKCPRSVVIQAPDGTTAVAPLVLEKFP